MRILSQRSKIKVPEINLQPLQPHLTLCTVLLHHQTHSSSVFDHSGCRRAGTHASWWFRIHYAGQYLSTKEVQQQFTKAILKKKFRAEHSKELDAYAESVKYFREENDGKLPSLKSLKKRKEELTKEIAERKKAYAPLREESRRLEIASDNVYSIFRKTDEMKSNLAWKREWEARVREKARQEQARQEQRERQPKRKKRSYDMSL